MNLEIDKLTHQHLTQLIVNRLSVIKVLLEPDMQYISLTTDILVLQNEETNLHNLLAKLQKG